ncbi:DUF2336 domain-containing protein [Aerophototrophica crusticola]|uniref:DUF2336 domain-containing protein n=1 Tax=Aerophototrophica crusticola TaxID=1709002 RepID=A0A858R4Q7_9PROT|nr:DUF2336 domain-containing protein [Rhodospirillaceae bacterium B3]
MTVAATALSVSDLTKLRADSSAQARIDTMEKVVADLEAGRLAGREAEIARDLLERFARDAEVAVREAVAWQIYNSPLLSDDLARQLADDVGHVAFPVLRHSLRLPDDVLLEVIAQQDGQKQVAIAGRPNVSAVVSDAIVESANLRAINTLLVNDGADILTLTLEKLADRYGDMPLVAEPLAGRAQLPLTVVEKLVHRVSEGIRQGLVQRYHLSAPMVAELVTRAREAATILMLQPLARKGTDMALLATHLHVNGRLTPSLLFRALCGGDIGLFLAGMAVRAGIGADNARTLLLDDGPAGLKALFDKARLSTVLLPPFRSAIKVLKEMGYHGEEERRRAYQVNVLARVYKECGHIEERAVDDLLMQLFDQKSDEMIDQAMEMAAMPFVPLRDGEVRGARV